MPKLIPDKKERGLFRHPVSGIYYLRKSIRGKGRIDISLRTTNRKEAKEQADLELSNFQPLEDGKGERRVNEIFYELLGLYLQTRAPATYENFKIHCKCYILPYFNGYKIKDVAPGIPGYVSHQKQHNPTRKLYHDIKHIHRILHFSREQGYIDNFSKFKLDRRERSPKPGKEYSNEEIVKILGALNEAHRLQAMLMVYTGMRPGEARCLKWEYIDFKNRTISLPAEAVKTRTARSLPVDKSVLGELALRKTKSKGSYVFPSKFDANKAEIRSPKPWQRAETKVRFKVRPHWFRHTYATRAVREGVPIPQISRSLGMSSAILEEIYLHVSMEDKNAMMGKVTKTMPSVGELLGNQKVYRR